MANWYDECFRKLFFDYHTQQNATEVGASFDGAAWAEWLKAAKVQAVSCIAKCGYGWRYYRQGRVGYVHPHLPEGLDILEDTVRECHKRNIRVIAYYHTFNSEPLAKLHPEWLARDRDGKAYGLNVCMLGDALEREMLPQIGEIVKNYPVDGIFLDGTYFAGQVCYCDSCRERFYRETGLQLPKSVQDASYRPYLSWVEEAYKKIRARCAAVVRENSEHALLSVNWAYTTRQAEPVPEGIGFMTQDISQSNMAFTISMQARNWALTCKPFDVMNHMALKWWQEWSVKPVPSLIQECALLLANGGRTWMGYQMYPWFGVENYLMETVRETFAYVEKMERLVQDARVLPHVGVWHDETQTQNHTVGEFSTFVDERAIRGVHRAFTLGGIPYHSACSKDMLRHRAEFKLIVVAGDQYLSPESIAALKEYVRLGGKLMVTGRSGMVDEKGAFFKNPEMEELLGVSVDDGYPYGHGYFEIGDQRLKTRVAGMPILIARPLMMAHSREAQVLAEARQIYLRSDGQPLFTEFTSNGQTFSPPGKPLGTAAITVREYGRGRVAYAAADLFESYAGNSQWSVKNLIKNLINDVLLREQALRMEAPDYVELALMERGDEVMVHMVNLMRESPMVDFSGAVENIIGEDIVPVHDIRLDIPCGHAPQKVWLGMSGRELAFAYKKGVVSVTVPKLEIHECLIIK